jgi:heme/copper-type cytochrome/quinol oxidase subunit 2
MLDLTDFNRARGLWNLMIWLGIGVFVLVERFCLRHDQVSAPAGLRSRNTFTAKLELAWTILPAVVLVIITVPTVKSIWKFQSGASNAADRRDRPPVVVEFRYPEQNITTERLYIPGQAVTST